MVTTSTRAELDEAITHAWHSLRTAELAGRDTTTIRELIDELLDDRNAIAVSV